MLTTLQWQLSVLKGVAETAEVFEEVAAQVVDGAAVEAVKEAKEARARSPWDPDIPKPSKGRAMSIINTDRTPGVVLTVTNVP